MSVSDGPLGDMERHLGRPDHTDPLWLDAGTAERLLRGEVTADDAPPGYRQVARLLAALNADAGPTELSDEEQAVSSISRRVAAAAPSAEARRTSAPFTRRLRIAGAVLVGSATLLAGLGVAGALPGAAQSVASDVLRTVGVSAPDPNGHSDGHPGERGRSAGTETTTPSGTGTGDTISHLATDPSTSGLEKGAGVSSEASDGQSQAGQHGPADASGNAPVSNPPVSTPPVDTPPVSTGPPSSTPTDDPRATEPSVPSPAVTTPEHP